MERSAVPIASVLVDEATDEDTLPQSGGGGVGGGSGNPGQQHLHREAGDGAASISHTTDEETSSLFDANDLSFNAANNPPAPPTTDPETPEHSSTAAAEASSAAPAVSTKPEAAPRESKQQKQLEEPLAAE